MAGGYIVCTPPAGGYGESDAVYHYLPRDDVVVRLIEL